MDLSGEGDRLSSHAFDDTVPKQASSPLLLSYVPVDTSQQLTASYQQSLTDYSPLLGETQQGRLLSLSPLLPSLSPLPATQVAQQPSTGQTSATGTIVPPTDSVPARKTKMSYAGAIADYVKKPRSKKTDSSLKLNLSKLKKASTAKARLALIPRDSTADPPGPTCTS
jgi:hypothetical protein